MIDRNSIVKDLEKFLITMQKVARKNSIPLPRNREKPKKFN